MPDIDDTRIEKLIDELDTLVPGEGARVKLLVYGGGPDESKIVANKAGYLRLGLAFLKAAYAECDKDNRTVKVNILGLTGEDGAIKFDWLERVENFDDFDRYPATTLKSKLFGIGCMIFIAFVVIFALCWGCFHGVPCHQPVSLRIREVFAASPIWWSLMCNALCLLKDESSGARLANTLC